MATDDDSSIPDVPDGIPQVFIDGYHGVQVANGVVRFNLTRETYPSSRQVVVAQLAMGLPTLLKVHAAMSGLIEQMRAEGTMPEGFEVVEKDGAD